VRKEKDKDKEKGKGKEKIEKKNNITLETIF